MNNNFKKNENERGADIFTIVISFLPVFFYCLVFVFLFIFNKNPDITTSYIFAIFSIIITFAFEIAEWGKICVKKDCDSVLCKIIHRQEFSFVLALVLFSVFGILYKNFFYNAFSWFERRNISTDRIVSIAVLVHLFLSCTRNVYLQFKKSADE